MGASAPRTPTQSQINAVQHGLSDLRIERDVVIEEHQTTHRTLAADRKDRLQRLADLTLDSVSSPRVKHVISVVKRITSNYPGKIIIFSKFVKFLDVLNRAFVLDPWCEKHGIPTIRFDGTVVSDEERNNRREQFQSPDDKAVLLITAGTGGQGLNFTAASHVIICEPWWRESDVQQAVGRAQQLGQQRIVHLYRVVAVDSVIDLALDSISQIKEEKASKIVSHLRRLDGDSVDIPFQCAGRSLGR